jgi:ADP-ribosyl-[dinitrogen reductase] hydrolase
MGEDYRRALAVATELALQAGALIRADFHRPGGPRGSRASAPVDNEAEALIRQRLRTAFPEWGYRGEETRPHLPAQDAEGHVWLVDPNDGTAGFLRGYRGSAVSIAVVRGGQPVLGVVYAPCAPDDAGDLLTWAEGCGPVQRNGVSIETPAWPQALDPQTVILPSEGAERRPADNLGAVAPARFRATPSIAYRLALAAAGEGAAAVSLHTPGDWDYGGGHALLHGAGGVLLNEAGEQVRYTADGASRVRFCFGGAPDVAAELVTRIWDPIFVGQPAPWPDPDLPFDFLRLQPGRNVADAGLLARAQGCLLGQVAGDALGALVEFQPAAAIAAAHPDGGPRLLADGGPHRIMAGQPTDDSELALLLARSLVAEGGFDAEAVAVAYARWYHGWVYVDVDRVYAEPGRRPFDVGGTTAQALGAIRPEHVRRGTAAATARAAASGASQANGALMRLSPLGIWGAARQPAGVAAAARADASLTHPHPVCQDASAVFAVALAQAVAHGGDATAVFEAAVAWARGAEVQGPVLAALEAARRAPPADYLTHQGWVLVALQNAFYWLLRAPSLEDGVVATVRAGGDTDTNAAICGALLGAVYGREAVPAQWRRMVLSCRPLAGHPGVRQPRPRVFWPTDALVLAERLLLAGETDDPQAAPLPAAD